MIEIRRQLGDVAMDIGRGISFENTTIGTDQHRQAQRFRIVLALCRSPRKGDFAIRIAEQIEG